VTVPQRMVARIRNYGVHTQAGRRLAFSLASSVWDTIMTATPMLIGSFKPIRFGCPSARQIVGCWLNL